MNLDLGAILDQNGMVLLDSEGNPLLVKTLDLRAYSLDDLCGEGFEERTICPVCYHSSRNILDGTDCTGVSLIVQSQGATMRLCKETRLSASSPLVVPALTSGNAT